MMIGVVEDLGPSVLQVLTVLGNAVLMQVEIEPEDFLQFFFISFPYHMRSF